MSTHVGIALLRDRVTVAQPGGACQTISHATITAEDDFYCGAAGRAAQKLPGSVTVTDFADPASAGVLMVLLRGLGLGNAAAVISGGGSHAATVAAAAGLNVLRSYGSGSAALSAHSLPFTQDMDEHVALVLDWGERGFRANLIETDCGIVEGLTGAEVAAGVGGADMDRLVAETLLRTDDLEAARRAKEAALSGTSNPLDPAQLSPPRALHAVMPMARRALEAAVHAAGSRRIEHLVFSGGVFESAALRAVFKEQWPLATPHEENPRYRDAMGALCLAGKISSRSDTARPLPTTVGLRDANDAAVELPLLSVDAAVRVADSVAEVVLSQVFRNASEDQGLEVIYSLPVGEDEAVTSMVISHEDGSRVVARCVESGAAEAMYDDAIAAGQTAYLARQVVKGMLELNAGNVAPGATVRVEVTIVRPVETAGDELKFALPVAWLPHSLAEQVPFSLRAQFDTSAPLQSLAGPPGSVVDLAARTLTLQRARVPLLQISLCAATEAVRHARVLVERHPERGTLAALVTLVPEVPAASTAACNEYCFVIDRSGSMAGPRMLAANRTLCECLARLPEGCAFNVVSFGSSHRLLYPRSVVCDEETRADAIAQVREFAADFGGTSLAPPLRAVFATPVHEAAHCRTVFVLTDGEVQDVLDVARAVSSERRSRTFTFGIGSGASRELCQRIAHAGGGKAVFCEDDLEEAVVAQLQRALMPSLADLRLSAPGLVAQSPATLRPVLHKEAYHVLLSLSPSSSEEEESLVRLQGTFPDGSPWTSTAALDVATARPGTMVHAMLAASAIKDLEEAADLDPLQARARVLELALAAGIASSATSFIAVEERMDATTGEMVSVEVPTRRAAEQDLGCACGAGADLLLLDVLPLSLWLGDFKILSRNTTIPSRKEVDVVMNATAPGRLQVGVFEGERPRQRDKSHLEDVTLELPPDVAAGAPRAVRVKFDIDANGILEVTLTDTASGRSASVTITNDKGRLSAAEIEEMILQAEKFAAEDALLVPPPPPSASPAFSYPTIEEVD